MGQKITMHVIRFLLLFLCVASAPALAAERTMIVLDASGSMWGTIDGRPKLEIARQALRQTLAKLPPGAEVGLMAYGHRERGNCADIELVVPPAPGSGAAIAAAADKMRFLGKTPLTESVRQAAAALRAGEDKATVILITDGVETCAADPCALADELEATGVAFTAHVVGFGLSREEGRQVACLAERTGGRYIRAGNEAELKDALARTVAPPAAPVSSPKSPKSPTAPAAAPVSVPKATVSAAAKPAIGASFPVKWTGPAGANDYVDLVPAGTAEVGKDLSYAYVEKGKDAELRAPGTPGTYDIRYIWAGPDMHRVLATGKVEVGDSAVALIAPASVPAGSAFEVTWKGPGQARDYVDVVPSGHKETEGELSYAYAEQGNPAQLRAPGDAGAYTLRYVLEAAGGRKVLVSVPLKVTAATAALAFPPKAKVGAELVVHWRGPKGAGDYVDIVPAASRETTGETDYAYVDKSEDGETVELKLPAQPGAYAVRYVLEASGGRRELVRVPLTVEDVEPVTLKAPARVAPAAAVEVQWSGPNTKGDYVDLVPAGAAETSGELDYAFTRDLEGKPATLTAPSAPGRYEVRYVLQGVDSRRVLARAPVEVR
jgi:Ca-activated chloride channel family protein